MFLKAIFFTALAFTIATQTFAQKQDVYFLKTNGKRVSTKDSADYIRIISEPDSGTVLFNIREYYMNGKLRLAGKSIVRNMKVFDGQVISFYPSGRRQQISSYKEGYIVGDCFTFYPNAKLYTITSYNESRFHVKACYDSTGKALMTNSEGYYIEYDDDFRTILSEGSISKGKKIGIWKGYDQRDSIAYTETFANGMLVKGESVDNKGNHYIFSKEQTDASFIGGETTIHNFLSRNFVYPEIAARHKKEASVVIFITVDKKGYASGFSAHNDPGYGLGDEAIRVLKLIPKWLPGTHYGCPEQMSFPFTINYSMLAPN